MKHIVFFAVLLASSSAAAHKPSDAHLKLDARGERVEGQLEIAIRDLDAALAIDDGDGSITWAELQAAAPTISHYLDSRLTIDGCTLSQGAPALVDLSDGAYWSTPLTASCANTDELTIRYQLLFDIDAQHRGLVHVHGQTLIARDGLPVVATMGESTSVGTFVKEGVWHIWAGLDHVLFLLCLLLPAVWRRESAKDVGREVFEIVTAFTLAHSITLVISTVGLFTLPSRFVETAIALSVVLAAVNNLVRIIEARWAVAFALGLLHGFGFSSVLVDMGLPSHELVGTLLGFNLGVELGQAAIVVVVLPLLFGIRKTLAYRALLFGGSGAVAVLAMVWTYERFAL